jgi:hypothetical protein
MFNSIHHFRNRQKLETIILDMNKKGNISEPVLKGYKIYHFALLHKLRCAKHHIDRLETILKINPSDIIPASDEFMFAVNLSIDGYFHSCGSALDILAREVLIYFGQTLPPNVYFKTARDVLHSNRPADPILNKLQEPSWKSDFSNYRNASTHEIIIASAYSINVQLNGDVEEKTIILPLPDDPRIDPANRTYNKNTNLLKYSTDNLRKVISLINQIYGEIYDRARTNNGFPI